MYRSSSDSSSSINSSSCSSSGIIIIIIIIIILISSSSTSSKVKYNLYWHDVECRHIVIAIFFTILLYKISVVKVTNNINIIVEPRRIIFINYISITAKWCSLSNREIKLFSCRANYHHTVTGGGTKFTSCADSETLPWW